MDFLFRKPKEERKPEEPVVKAAAEPAPPEELPVLPLKNTVVFPLTVLPLVVQKPRSVRLVDDAVVADRRVVLVALRDPEVEEPLPPDLYTTGTVATIHRLARTPDGTLHIIVQGLERVRLGDFTQTEPYLRVKVLPAPDTTEEGVELEALVRNTTDLFRRLVGLAAYLPEDAVSNVLNAEDPRQMAYMIAMSTRMDMAVRQEILELDQVSDKLRRLLVVLSREVEVLELGKKIQTDTQSGIEKVQREYFLREQMKAIQKELGEEDEQAVEVRELREKIAAAAMGEEAEKEALREVGRLAKLPTAAAEYGVIRTYLEWLTELPWQTTTTDNYDIAAARRVLDEDHYDLVRLKARILEYLAVRKLRQERRAGTPAERRAGTPAERRAEGDTEGDIEAPITDHIRREREGVILCFVGPPGVGKTSLGQSIARALGRKFIRQSFGGMHDEAEVRGHRRTYIGAMPGRIIQAIRRVGTRNPVFMLDEVDKIGNDFRGDPSSALLEVLDPEQNREFRDHYLDVPFDLSQVMFIATANVLDTVPAPLRDRMEILQLSGYTEEEKVAIAKDYLIPRQIRENGLRAGEVAFDDEALRAIIREYTREAGVRDLERRIGMVCRKLATKIAEGVAQQAQITPVEVAEHLGKPTFFPESVERTQIPGVATGLAWTPAGGDILFIEATKMKGGGGFTLTGQLGDVMKESAQAALSYVRSKAKDLGLDEDLFKTVDVHLHIPAGAIPKDGPSAGVAMATALVSLFRDQPINPLVGMTGEITLRGQVLPVGGIKEKVLAAHRAGLRTLCLPRRNDRDLDELPQDVRDEITFVLVDRMEQVLATVFGEKQGNNSAQNEKEQGGPE
jgi:ATP-dependent Lon protease